MESDWLGAYSCKGWQPEESINSSDFQTPNDTKSYVYIKIFIDISYSEAVTELAGLVLVPLDELIKKDPTDKENSSTLRTAITSFYGRLIFRPRLWCYVNDLVKKVTSSMARDPRNAGLKILPMVVSLSIEDFIDGDPEEDSEEDPEGGDPEEEEEDMDLDLDCVGLRGGPASEALVAALDIVHIQGSGDTCVICYEQLGARSIARRMPCMHVYHCECISEWLEKSNTCPLCRFELSTRG